MKNFIFALSLVLLFSLPVVAQEPTTAKASNDIESTTQLTVEESKQLKQAFELAQQAETEAKAAQDRSTARNAEAKALYWQLIVLKKIDLDKWQFAGFNQDGLATFLEKPQPAKEKKKGE